MSNYETFLAQKKIIVQPSGMDFKGALNPHLKPFQKAIVLWALRQGRCAIFASTGLGKTLMLLEFARVLYECHGVHSLCLSPLAVADQTVREAIKFSIPGVAYAKDQAAAVTPICITNYERFDKFDINRFDCIILDESSRIKDEGSATRRSLTDACRNVRWKLCASATPAPNDHVELGNHSEFLNVMTQKEMLSTFFVKDDSSRMEGNASYRLKRHAYKDFWSWLASWSVMVRKPDDLGFDGREYELPPLTYRKTLVESSAEPPSGAFFPDRARTLRDRIRARRTTLSARIATVLEIIKKEPGENWILWCRLNDEQEALEKALGDECSSVYGSLPIDDKVERIWQFINRDKRILLSKPSIAGHGLNLQFCRRMVFVGVDDSFESMYQSVRRCWRFGQTEEVIAHLVYSDLDGNILDNLKRKEAEFDEMLNEMSIYMIDIMRENVRGRVEQKSDYNPQQIIQIPEWVNESARSIY